MEFFNCSCVHTSGTVLAKNSVPILFAEGVNSFQLTADSLGNKL
jgi:hypothetical protein